MKSDRGQGRGICFVAETLAAIATAASTDVRCGQL